jgi:hypothetical protein
MKRILFISQICITIIATALFAQQAGLKNKKLEAEKLAQKVLLGRKVTIRVYNNLQTEPDKYQKVTVPLNGLSTNAEAIKSAYPAISDSAEIVIMASDQEDKVVAAVLGDDIFAEPYQPGKRISLWPKSLRESELKYCVFVDALGNPMPRATVEVYLQRRYGGELSTPSAVVQLDKQGRMKPPSQDPTLQNCCLVVTHADYGTAIVEPELIVTDDKSFIRCTVPMVRLDSEQITQSFFGHVVDSNGNPVAAAVVECFDLKTVDGSPLRWANLSYPKVKAITDKQGQFSFYVPVYSEGEKRELPQGAKCSLYIKPPAQSALLYRSKIVRAGQAELIELERVLKASISYFIFEDEFGPVTEPNMLDLVRLEFHDKQGRQSGRCSLSKLIQRKRPVPSTYFATAEWYGKSYIFEPVTIEADVTEPVVFKPARIEPAERIYIGQVVHGVTGWPIADALVMKQPVITDINCADLESDEREKDILRSFGPEIELNSPEIMYLKEDFIAKKMCLTDADGCFVISLPNVPGLTDNIIVARKDFLGARQQIYMDSEIEPNSPPRRTETRFQPDENGIVRLAPLKLYPAGVVMIEPIAPSIEQTEQLGDEPVYHWLIINWFNFGEDKPSWFEAMSDYTNQRKNNGASLFYKRDLIFKSMQKIYIPSDLQLTLKITAIVEHGQNSLEPFVLADIKLKQGEVLSLGQVEFDETIGVIVKVVDQSARPVEGVTVRILDEYGLFYRQRAVTDQDGIAFMNIPRHSRGQFIVEHFFELAADGTWTKPLRQGIHYEVAGQEDTNRVFTLQLSDDFVDILFE